MLRSLLPAWASRQVPAPPPALQQPRQGRPSLAQGEVEDEPWEWKTPFNASPVGAVVRCPSRSPLPGLGKEAPRANAHG